MSSTIQPINIFDYSDYRKFLKDWYDLRKKEDSVFTYRYIASRVGFKSAGHFTQILTNRINLSDSMTSNFISFLNLGKKESEYFELLVRFDQAKTHAEKRRLFERLMEFKENRAAIIDPSQYEYYDKWYYVAIREVLSYYEFSGDYAELAKKVRPGITPAEARQAIELLESIGLIEKQDDGIYRKKTAVVSANPVGTSIAINNQALQTMKLAAEALDRFPKEERNISGVAFSVSRRTYAQIQEEVRNFRKKILEIALIDQSPDSVYQFNVQLFPLSEVPPAVGEGEAP